MCGRRPCCCCLHLQSCQAAHVRRPHLQRRAPVRVVPDVGHLLGHGDGPGGAALGAGRHQYGQLEGGVAGPDVTHGEEGGWVAGVPDGQQEVGDAAGPAILAAQHR